MGLQSMESRSWTRLSDSACELLVVRWRVGSCSLSRDRTQPSVLGAWSAPPGRCQTPGVFIEQLPSLPTGPTARTQTRRHTRRLTHTCTCARTQTHMHTHTHIHVCTCTHPSSPPRTLVSSLWPFHSMHIQAVSTWQLKEVFAPVIAHVTGT